jgi:2,3-bisphosphoglycerate-independent phosphoglycerate mutase
MHHKAFLIILDGWGIGTQHSSDAIYTAHTPYVDGLFQKYPNATLVTYGGEVGLPEGQMGNSEVGHLNIGAGRIVYQDFARINNDLKSGDFAKNPELIAALTKAKENNTTVHLIGLLSDGGVHSHTSHLRALCDATEQHSIKNVCIHAFLDGRDTDPYGGIDNLKEISSYISDKKNIHLSTIIGRYYAMDRDNRWERIQKCYNLIVNGEATVTTDNPEEAIQSYYNDGITDEFMEAIKVENGNNKQTITDGDLVIFFNFRTDRPRQLTYVLTQEDIVDFGMKKLNIDFLTMTKYDSSFNNINVMYEKDNITLTIGEVIERNNLKQLRIAETEKYPHVTFFLSGGREEVFKNEKRIVVNSPKVATYDLQPEMSAYELTNRVHSNIIEDNPDLIILNYANADMVGHTGNFQAAIDAVEDLDSCLEALIPIAIKADYKIVIIADHGNSDYMINEDGSPNTAHTTNLVPIIVIDPENKVKHVKNGKLADVAPTLLSLMKLDIPKEMTGNKLI